MRFAFTGEQDELRRVVREVVAEGKNARTALDDGPGTNGVWNTLVELGVNGINSTTNLGGAGGTMIDAVVVVEETARVLDPAPVAAHVVAMDLLNAAPSAAQHVPRILDSGTPVAICWDASGGADVRAAPCADGWRLDGGIPVVAGAAGASWLVVPALDPDDNLALFLVEGGVERQASLDPTQALGTLSLQGAEASLVADVTTRTLLDVAQSRRWTMVAVEAAAVSRRTLELSSDYAKQRVQFGRPIGTFQAVKHRLADMLVDAENALSAAYALVWSDDTPTRGLIDAAVAQSVEAAVRNASHAVQLHGGIGVTWEHDLHLYLRRAKQLELLAGPPADRFAAAGRWLLDAVT